MSVIPVLAFTLLGFASRFYQISLPDYVAWDEAHFGKFAGYYVSRQFYFDVHPPAGKFMLGMVAKLAGLDPSYKFDSGSDYPDSVPYVPLRQFCALFGALLVPLTYLTLTRMKCSPVAAGLGATMVLFDLAYTSLSRLILLDSMLTFFIALSFYCHVSFMTDQHRPFSFPWFFWLAATGASLGMASSIKHVGFFITALVGFYTIYDLWELFGDLKMPKIRFFSHFMARAVCLIAIPIFVYVFFFALHFAVLTKSGPGDSVMSSLFQAHLEGNHFDSHPREIIYGSTVTLRNHAYGGGLLHSHVQKYPVGSKQQQITTYSHHDDNNHWIISKINRNATYNTIEYLKDGDQVILRHKNTKSNLHSHYVEAPLSKGDYEVSGYGNEAIGDANDFWRVEVLNPSPDGKIRTMTSKLRFHHQTTKCILSSSAKTLPEWGFKQHEVSCMKKDFGVSNMIWNVEMHMNDQLPDSTEPLPKTSFLENFLQLNFVMVYTNNALVPDPNKVDPLASKPSGWPFLREGVRMTSWADDKLKLYLVGNPIVWWLSTVAVFLFGFFYLAHDATQKRGVPLISAEEWDHYRLYGILLVGAYVLNYLPYWIMDRVTYLHHYLPALYFAILIFGFIFDHLFPVRADLRLRTFFRDFVLATSALVVVLAVVGTYWYFFPVPYGYPGASAGMAKLKWVSSWNIV